MRGKLAWWTVAFLLLLAWVPFGIDELIERWVWGVGNAPEWLGALLFGHYVFIWWPCNILAAIIILYKLSRWMIRRVGTSKA